METFINLFTELLSFFANHGLSVLILMGGIVGSYVIYYFEEKRRLKLPKSKQKKYIKKYYLIAPVFISFIVSIFYSFEDGKFMAQKYIEFSFGYFGAMVFMVILFKKFAYKIISKSNGDNEDDI